MDDEERWLTINATDKLFIEACAKALVTREVMHIKLESCAPVSGQIVAINYVEDESDEDQDGSFWAVNVRILEGDARRAN